jgi:hypothetical protein
MPAELTQKDQICLLRGYVLFILFHGMSAAEVIGRSVV